MAPPTDSWRRKTGPSGFGKAHTQAPGAGTGASRPRAINVAMLLSEGQESQGGMGRIIGYLVRSLAATDPDISTYPMATRLAGTSMLKHLSVPVSLAKFVRFTLACPIDVVHINVAPRGSTWRKMVYAQAARALKRPVLIHLHGSAYDEYFRSLRPTQARMVQRFFQNADHVVALSEQWADFVREDLGVPAAQVTEIANGVPAADDLQPRPRERPAHIAFFGVVGHRKGTDVLIDALGALAARGLQFRVTIGGNGDVEAARAHARKVGIADRVHFLGWVDQPAVDQVLRDADIFVLPSRAENQPVAILEAMARALPVVATRIGAIPRQIEDGVTGLLVEPGDVDGLATCLAELIEDQACRLAMGAAALKLFEERFSIDACARKFALLYRQLAR
ncbi:glycosyltransferase family 4 protein [Novosphingobium sp. RD2P27]|uniref:Glycosyltransferase family 4 protein n=1 Tax=Novosphingobium kalidii TaxID=3230299 RepID=A0ABV2D018_9SPHN